MKDTKTQKYRNNMSKKQIFGFIIFGVILTTIVSLFPQMVGKRIANALPYAQLTQEEALVSYLRTIQGEGVYIGLHGYNHTCPLDGSTNYELYSPYGTVPLSTIEWRVREGLGIFKDCNINADCYVFPGEAYDQRDLGVMRDNGFSIMNYTMEGQTKQMPVANTMLDFSFPAQLVEHTWDWKTGVLPAEYQTSLNNIQAEKPVEILVHIQDWTDKTEEFVQYAIAYCGTTVIRCDDIASNRDLPNLRQIVDFAQSNHVSLILAVIPTHPPTIPTSLVIPAKLTWWMFLAFFMLPIGIMTPWAVYFKKVRRIKPCGGNPHYPSVSLLLPGYNEEKIIGRAIEQALAQDYKGAMDVIVIDDGSSDKTGEIANRYITLFPNIKLINHPQNMGKPAALNTGFAQATGDICIFQDTDSTIATDLVSKMVAHFSDPQVGMVAGMIVIENDHNLLTKLQQIEYLYGQTIARFCQASHKNVLICPGAATAIRTAISKRIPSTDRTVVEDADLTFSVMREGWKVTQEPEAISYTEAPDSIYQLFDQRKRWVYGFFQVVARHSWSLKKGDPWVLLACLSCIVNPVSVLLLSVIPLLYFTVGTSYLYMLAFNMLITLGIFCIAHIVGVLLYSGKSKARLLFLLPVYIFYQAMLQLLFVYLVFAYVTGIGIRVRYGGKIVHAVR